MASAYCRVTSLPLVAIPESYTYFLCPQRTLAWESTPRWSAYPETAYTHTAYTHTLAFTLTCTHIHIHTLRRIHFCTPACNLHTHSYTDTHTFFLLHKNAGRIIRISELVSDLTFWTWNRSDLVDGKLFQKEYQGREQSETRDGLREEEGSCQG